MRVALGRYAQVWIYFPYVLFSAFLAFAREPFRDEAWYTFPAVTLQRVGIAQDFVYCDAARPYRFLYEPFAAILSVWYRVVGLEIVWGRALDVVAGLALLVVFNRCLITLGVRDNWRKIAMMIGGANYFLLYAVSQIRPEAFVLLLAVASLSAYLSWQSQRQATSFILAHLFIAFATLLHWQAIFIVVALWLSMILFDRKRIQFKLVMSVVLLYGLFVVACWVRVYPHWADLISELQWQFSGNMAGHLGGIPGLAIQYLQTAQWFKLLGIFLLAGAIGVGIVAFLFAGKNERQITFGVFGLSGYVSWLATAGAGDDYHAAWLTLGIMMTVIISVEMLKPSLIMRRMVAIGLLAVPLLLAIYGGFFAVKTIYQNPRVQVFERDLAAFDSEFQLMQTTVWGDRQVMWYFGFDWMGYPPPEYFISSADPSPNSIVICQIPYVFVKRGLGYVLYHQALR